MNPGMAGFIALLKTGGTVENLNLLIVISSQEVQMKTSKE